MVEQVAEGEEGQLFLEQVGALRAYALEVFDGLG